MWLRRCAGAALALLAAAPGAAVAARVGPADGAARLLAVGGGDAGAWPEPSDAAASAPFGNGAPAKADTAAGAGIADSAATAGAHVEAMLRQRLPAWLQVASLEAAAQAAEALAAAAPARASKADAASRSEADESPAEAPGLETAVAAAAAPTPVAPARARPCPTVDGLGPRKRPAAATDDVDWSAAAAPTPVAPARARPCPTVDGLGPRKRPAAAADDIDWSAAAKLDVEWSRRLGASARKPRPSPAWLPQPGSKIEFPLRPRQFVQLRAVLEEAVFAHRCPSFYRSELTFEVRPPAGAAPGLMLNTTLPLHGFMPIIVPEGWQPSATIPVQYEVADARPSRALSTLQKKRYTEKLKARVASGVGLAGPMTSAEAGLCWSLVHRLLWLELLQAELVRLPVAGCPTMGLSIEMRDLDEARWPRTVDVAGAFARYLGALADDSVEQCGPVAEEVALQLVVQDHHKDLIRVHLDAHMLAIGALAPVDCCSMFLPARVAAPPALWPALPAGLRREMWVSGCPELGLHSVARIHWGPENRMGEIVIDSPHGKVSVHVPADFQRGGEAWAVYRVPVLRPGCLQFTLLLYSMALEGERSRLAEFGVQLDMRPCYQAAVRALEVAMRS